MADARQGISGINFNLPSFGKNRESEAPKPAAEDCPPITLVDDLRSLHQFTDQNAPRAENRLSSVQVTHVSSQCGTTADNIVVDLGIHFSGTLGPRAKAWRMDRPSFGYPYFVAVTTPDGQVMAKEIFGLSMTYDKTDGPVTRTETLRQIMPRTGEHGGRYELLIGFQLTEAELAYNRALLASASAYEGGSHAAATSGPTVITVEPAAKPPVESAPLPSQY